LPTAEEISLFGLDSSADKRARVVDRLLASPGYATHWTRYWRDTIFMRATENRSVIGQKPFEEWFAEQLKTAETEETLHTLDNQQRVLMQKRVNGDPFVRAILVGMAESNSTP